MPDKPAITTICVNCKHFIDGDWTPHRCGSKGVERPKAMDFVTGKQGWTNGRGLYFFNPQDKHPFCRDVNKSGECYWYEGNDE